jgi:hypothetical protein
LKKYRDIKQMRNYREFHVFWSKFQRLFNELSLIEKILLNDFRVKISYELQKMLTIKRYRATNIYEFVHLCFHIDQILRDIKNKLLRNANYRRIADTTIFLFTNKSKFASSTAINKIKLIIRQWSSAVSRSRIFFVARISNAYWIIK